MSLMQEFKDFAVKGNVVDLAVGLIIGAEFSKIVNSLVSDIIMPPIGMILGKVDFKNLFVVLKDKDPVHLPFTTVEAAQKAGAVTMNLGNFITTLISFTIIAFCVFMVIKLVNKLRGPAPAPAAADAAAAAKPPAGKYS